MNIIQSIDQIRDFVSGIRNLRKGFITNFFLNLDKHSIWIEEGTFFYLEEKECTFFIKGNKGFYNLFFSATTIEVLCAALKKLPIIQELISLDIVGLENNPILKALEDAGFYRYEVIYRMSRMGLPGDYHFSPDVEEARVEDIPTIKSLLDQHFDALSEQICCKKELEIFVKKHTILVYRDKVSIRGFIIYGLQGVTLYLRYWWVDPECRNLGIGAKLYHSFFNRGKDTKRQVHWLIETNDNARVRYEHYGYKKETLYNYVLLNKQMDKN